jgi:hypothetical protein
MSLCPPLSPPVPCPPRKANLHLAGMQAPVSKGLSPLFHVRRISRQTAGLKPALSKGLSPPSTNHVLRRVPALAVTTSRHDIKLERLQTIRQS